MTDTTPLHDNRAIVIADQISPAGNLNDIVDFLSIFDVPDDLQSLRAQATTIACLLTRFADLANLCSLAQSIGNIASLERYPAFEFSAEKSDLRGLYETHPMYCLLAHTSAKPVAAARYKIFLAQFTYALIKWRRVIGNRQYLLRDACRAARRFGNEFARIINDEGNPIQLKVLGHILNSLPDTSCNGYAAIFSNCVKKAASIERHDLETETLELIDLVFKCKRPKPKKPSTDETEDQAHSGSNARAGHHITRPTLPGSTTDIIRVFPKRSGTAGGNEDEPDDGGDTEEGHTITYTKIKSRAPVYSTNDDRFQRIGNTNRSAAIARANQLLPMAFDSLNAYDIEQICSHLDRFASADSSDLELDAYLALQIFCGQPREQVLNAVLVTENGHHSVNNLGYSNKKGAIFFFSWTGQKSAADEDNPTTQSHTRELSLRLPSAVRAILKRWIDQSDVVTGDRLFKTPPVNLITRANSLLKTMSSKTGCRLTVTRLEGFLYRELAAMPTSDPSVAILLTGQPDHGGYMPATYTAWPLSRLASFYHECQTRLGKWAAVDPWWLDGCLRVDTTSKLVTGSAVCPLREVVQKIANKNVKELRRLILDPPNHTGFIAQHNTYIKIFYQYVQLALGARAVTHLILHPDCINLALGVMYISDKDNTAYYHGRMVFLPPPVVQAFRNLTDHLDALVPHLAELNAAAANSIHWADRPQPTGRRTSDITLSWKQKYPLFLLEIDGAIKKLLPGTAMIDWNKPNATRHRFRTDARLAGVDDAVVRWHQGHWSVGQEPAGRFSGMSPRHLRKCADGWMTDALQLGTDFYWNPPISPLIK